MEITKIKTKKLFGKTMDSTAGDIFDQEEQLEEEVCFHQTLEKVIN